MEIVGLIVFCLFMALANVAGVGGGGVAIPLIMAFFHFKTKEAIAISSFTILCCTTARFILNYSEKHPEKPNVTVIDYGMTTVMMPATLVGAQVGALVLLTFPALIIQIILTVVLAGLAWQSTRKAFQITKKENEARALKALETKEATDKAVGAKDLSLAKVAPITVENTPANSVNHMETAPIDVGPELIED
jgi:uncharacterized membrane protein YfcA